MEGNGAVETNDLWRKKGHKKSFFLLTTLDSTFIDASREKGVIDADNAAMRRLIQNRPYDRYTLI